MLRRILSISGKPGLYKLISQGKNMLIVEALTTGKRMPAYSRDKVMSLGDISIYTTEGDKPLAEVMELVKEKAQAQPIDVKALGDDAAIRAFFAEVLPTFDQDRVYTTDIKKLLSWYNILIGAGINQFVEEKSEEASDEKKEEGSEEK